MAVKTLGETHILVEKLIEYLQQEHFPPREIELVKRAWSFAENHYTDVDHPIGKPYLEYAAEVATRLGGLHSDPVTISTALIIPPFPDTKEVFDEIQKQFKAEGELIELVEEVLQLGYLEWNFWAVSHRPNEFKQRQVILQKMFLLAINEMKCEEENQNLQTAINFQKREKQLENLIRMFLTSPTDARALIIKLVDRLYYIKLLKDVPSERQEAINYIQVAKITLAIYAQLADRLGMWQLKSNLEDMSFRLIEPGQYKEIAGRLAAKKQEREKNINDIIPIVQAKLEEYGIEATITGRAKHIYSIYNKMAAKHLSFEEVKDLLGIRIIVDSKQDCYDTLEIILDSWPAETDVYNGESYRDWIATPKENQYQSLHTTIKIGDKVVEIQIRTYKMHEIAEYGVASAHWRYKESKAYRKGKTPRVQKLKEQIWDQQVAELRKSVVDKDKQESLDQAKSKLLKDRIYVVTPEGHVIDLPIGATPLDFAYRIHTDLGHHYIGAKVNGHIVRRDYKLKNGEIVELIISNARKGPNPEWLAKSRDEEGNSNYLFARTSQARGKIINWLNKYDEEYKARHAESQKPKQGDTQKPKTEK